MKTIVKEVYVLDGGTETLDNSALASGLNYGTLIDVPVMQWLLRTDHGCILVDTGNDPRLIDTPGGVWEPSLVAAVAPRMKAENHLYAQLDLAGFKPEDVKIVIYTHLHHDHAGGARLFPHAKHIVQKEEYRWAYNPDYFTSHIYLKSDLDHDIDWVFVDGDVVLFPGVHLMTTPGHTPGHQSIVLWDVPNVGNLILAGDAIYLTENVRRDLPPSIMTNTRDVMNSLHRLTALAEAQDGMLFVGHDMAFFNNIRRAPEPLQRVSVTSVLKAGKTILYPNGLPSLG